jgi:hypothetical protein
MTATAAAATKQAPARTPQDRLASLLIIDMLLRRLIHQALPSVHSTRKDCATGEHGEDGDLAEGSGQADIAPL